MQIQQVHCFVIIVQNDDGSYKILKRQTEWLRQPIYETFSSNPSILEKCRTSWMENRVLSLNEAT